MHCPWYNSNKVHSSSHTSLFTHVTSLSLLLTHLINPPSLLYHSPFPLLYNKAHRDEWQATAMKANMETLLASHHVNIVFAGTDTLSTNTDTVLLTHPITYHLSSLTLASHRVNIVFAGNNTLSTNTVTVLLIHPITYHLSSLTLASHRVNIVFAGNITLSTNKHIHCATYSPYHLSPIITHTSQPSR